MAGRREDVWSNTWAIDPNVNNRFDNYQTQFDYGSMSGILDKLYNSQKNQINQNTGSNIAKNQRDTASRLASQGITGGSILNSQIDRGNSDIIGQGYNALNQLGIARQGQELGLMDRANQNNLSLAQLAQNADFQNKMNELRKMQSLNDQVNNWEQMDMQRAAQPGLLDDIFGGLGLISQIGSIPITGGASGKSLLGSLGLF